MKEFGMRGSSSCFTTCWLFVFFSCPSALDFLELGLRFLSKDAFHIRSQDETARLLEVIVIQ